MVATFNETSAVTFRKYIVKQGINNSKCFKKFELLWSHSSIFKIWSHSTIASKNNFFEWFLPLNWQMVATSTETRAAIFRKRKHAAEKGMSVSKR